MAENPVAEKRLVKALELLEPTVLPAMRFVEFADDILNRVGFVRYYAFDCEFGDQNLVIAFRPLDADTTPVALAILDHPESRLTPMTIDEFIDYFMGPKCPDNVKIETVADRILELSHLKNICHLFGA